jgi:hypothetical protein
MSDGGTAEAESTVETAGSDDGYGGLLGAYPYAFRQSESRLFRSYVALGGLAAALVVIVFTSALIQLIANTVGTAGGTFSFVRSFYIVIGLVVVVPLLAPVLLVARRHRRSVSTRTYDRALAASGYLFLVSLYLALVIAAPPELRDAPSGVTAPVVEALYSLPPIAGGAPPLLAVLFGYLVHRRLR